MAWADDQRKIQAAEACARKPSAHEYLRILSEDNASLMAWAAESEDELSRVYLAMNRRCPVGLLERLSRDEQPIVQVQVARNPSTSTPTLRRLAASDVDEVRWEAEESLEQRGES